MLPYTRESLSKVGAETPFLRHRRIFILVSASILLAHPDTCSGYNQKTLEFLTPPPIDDVELVPDAHDGEQEPLFQPIRPYSEPTVRGNVKCVHGHGSGGNTPSVSLDPEQE